MTISTLRNTPEQIPTQQVFFVIALGKQNHSIRLIFDKFEYMKDFLRNESSFSGDEFGTKVAKYLPKMGKKRAKVEITVPSDSLKSVTETVTKLIEKFNSHIIIRTESCPDLKNLERNTFSN